MERRDGVLQETVNQGIHLHLPGFRSNESFILLMFNRDFKTSSVQIDNYILDFTYFFVVIYNTNISTLTSTVFEHLL